MTSSANSELIPLLSADDVELRTIALHWLAEGYALDSGVMDAVFTSWDRFGAGAAYPEFPMLSHFPVAAERIAECCQRALEMTKGKPLTDLETRCAGKLIEQVTKLPAAVLAPHLELLEQTVATPKIYFRVDLPAVRHRIELLDSAADRLAGQLDESIDLLSSNPEETVAVHHGIHALEALRRQHPNYMNLAGVLAATPPDDGPRAISFQLTMQSLMQFAEPGLELSLGRHLHDSRESVFVSAVDALVRAGSDAAALALIDAYLPAEEANRQWIARGLQRLRVKGLAERLAELRTATEDPRLWLMLLVAEIRQTDIDGIMRLVAELGRVVGHSYALVNSLLVFHQVHLQGEAAQFLRAAFVQYLARTNQELHQSLETRQNKLHITERRSREKAREQALKRYRKGNHD